MYVSVHVVPRKGLIVQGIDGYAFSAAAGRIPWAEFTH